MLLGAWSYRGVVERPKVLLKIYSGLILLILEEKETRLHMHWLNEQSYVMI